jgi:hypothetical protein
LGQPNTFLAAQVGDWIVGEPVAVMYMGTGAADKQVSNIREYIRGCPMPLKRFGVPVV